MPTPEHKKPSGKTHSLLAAALAVPGISCDLAIAASPPDQTEVAFKHLSYKDWQEPTGAFPDGDRISVQAPSISIIAPIGDDWSILGSGVIDSISGASPYYHDVLSGASGIGVDELRKAGDLKLTRYFQRTTIGLGVLYSTEHDYISRAASFDVNLSSADNNRTYTFGAGVASDSIDASEANITGKKKQSLDVMAGVTQVLTRYDIAQLNITYSTGKGYYTDPYKSYWGIDRRPEQRDQVAVLLRLNHFWDTLNASSRMSYRYYQDSFGVVSNTYTFEWAQQLPLEIALTPAARYYSQTQADFYYNIIDYNNTEAYYSADQRLSAYGAITIGGKLEKQFQNDWRSDIKIDYYMQRAGLKPGGGSEGMAGFNALFIQTGIAKKF